MRTSLHGIAEAARRKKTERFRSLYSFFNRVMFEEAYYALNKRAAAGVDKVTYREYGKNLQQNVIDLEERLKQKRYRAKFVKRVFILKANGKTRPLGIPALEDKIVQLVARNILEALFEPLFLSCSYGYRPNRSARKAVEDLREELRKKYGWVVEADITSFFDTIDHEWLIKMLETRVKDRSFIRLIQKWLRAGVLHEDGTVYHPNHGTPQGSIISPILANIYLHFVLDQWFVRKIKPLCTGEAYLIRYADDFVAAFRFHKDAQRFYRLLRERMEKFGLTLSKEKTRKFRFNRFNKENSEPFSFLGFEFRWTYSRKGKDLLRIRTTRKKVRAIVAAFTLWCREHRSKRIRWIMGMVKSKLNGIRNYMNVPGNSARIKQVYLLYKRILYRWLNRRSERKSYTWKTFMFTWRFYNVSKCQYLYNEGVQISFLPYLG